MQQPAKIGINQKFILSCSTVNTGRDCARYATGLRLPPPTYIYLHLKLREPRAIISLLILAVIMILIFIMVLFVIIILIDNVILMMILFLTNEYKEEAGGGPEGTRHSNGSQQQLPHRLLVVPAINLNVSRILMGCVTTED